jgi:hypothetical protein
MESHTHSHACWRVNGDVGDVSHPLIAGVPTAVELGAAGELGTFTCDRLLDVCVYRGLSFHLSPQRDSASAIPQPPPRLTCESVDCCAVTVGRARG